MTKKAKPKRQRKKKKIPASNALLNSKDWLYEQYITKNITTYQIAKTVGYNPSSIQRKLKKFSIKKDQIKRSYRRVNLLTKEWLFEHYVIKRLSMIKIANLADCSITPVKYWLNEYGISKRSREEFSLKGKESPIFGRKASFQTRQKMSTSAPKKENHHNWNGGKTPLYLAIRGCSRYKIWRLAIFERDNFSCQWCGDNTGGNLNADHIKQFIIIIKENNIVSLEDAEKCEELWDINNGRTLCEKCHRKTDTFGGRTGKNLKEIEQMNKENNQHPEMKVVKLPSAGNHNLPSYANPGDAGLDLQAAIESPVVLGSLERVLVPTGQKIKIPNGCVGFVCPRSGRALKEGLSIVNAPGVIDSGYLGETKVILVNLSKDSITINPGDKIAQLVVLKVEQVNVVQVNELEQTQRSENGFGSTGK